MTPDTILQGDALARQPHPAKFSEPILAMIRAWCPAGSLVLDPFAGVGMVHRLNGRLFRTVGVELEYEWARQHPRTAQGDALRLPLRNGAVDAVVTSPCYGNRMADHHEARDVSKRITYRHTLGRPLRPQNAGGLQWGPAYRDFHRAAWLEVARVVCDGGRFILNVSDHIRKGRRVRVSAWHLQELERQGWRLVHRERVRTRRMRFGRNGSSRVASENIFVLERMAERRLAPLRAQASLFPVGGGA